MEYGFDELVLQAKQKDSRAAEEIISRLQPLVFSVIRSGSKTIDKEDLYQEACLVILECINNYEPQRGVPFLAYVKKAIQYRIWNLNRSVRYEISLDAPGTDSVSLSELLRNSDLSTEEKTIVRSETEELNKALTTLSPKQRHVICLHYFGEKKLIQIAKERKVHPKGIMRLKKRALIKLKKEIERHVSIKSN